MKYENQCRQDRHLEAAATVEPAMEEDTALATCECLEVEVVLVVVIVVMMVYITMPVVVPHDMMIIILAVVIWWHWWARSKKKQSGSLPQDFPASRPQGSSNATLATNIVF